MSESDRDIGSLNLSRRAGESIQIGDDIEIRLLAVQGRLVRLQVRAPRSVAIQRRELLGPAEGEPS